MKNLMFALIVLTLLSCKQKTKEQPFITGLEKKEIPAIGFLLTDSVSYFSTAKFSEKQKTVLFYYSPTCPYCRAQLRRMIGDIEKYKDMQICLLSGADINSIRKFGEEFELTQYPNIINAQDTGYYVSKIYRIPGVPFTVVFDKRRLKMAYLGGVSNETLLKN